MPSAANSDKLKHFVPFDGLSTSHLERVITHVTCLDIPAKRVLFKRDQADDYAYFLVDGTLDLADADFQIETFAADDDENYLALDNFPTHSVSAITTQDAVVYRIDKDKLALIEEWIETCNNQPGSVYDDDDGWMSVLLQSGLFSQIPPTQIQSLFSHFKAIEVDMGDTVVEQGESGEMAFVCKQGYALVYTQQQNGQRHIVATIGPGQFFGVESLISDKPRNASIVMASDGEMMQLDKDQFRDLLQDLVIRHVTDDELESLKEESDRPFVMIDVRPKAESKYDRIPRARAVPLSELRGELNNLESEFNYVIFASDAANADLAAYLLTDAGLEVYVLSNNVADSEEEKTNKEGADKENTA